ncbi:MAG: hypothetical protein EG825_00585 [Rhodocyclaceae bacterium]|nr:hypothetical protein [Rhodocyclaceae bacterium]
MKRRNFDPLLRTQPWKVVAVFQPIEHFLHKLEVDGTVETTGRHVVFQADVEKHWFDLVEAIRGVIQFHHIARDRYGLDVNTEALERLTNKLDVAAPIFLGDIEAVRRDIASCKQQALRLRLSQAEDILTTIRISAELDAARAAA